MDHKTKITNLTYYAGTVCVCNQPKKDNRWLCLECKNMMSLTPEEDRLNAACTEHTLAAIEYIRVAQLMLGK